MLACALVLTVAWLPPQPTIAAPPAKLLSAEAVAFTGAELKHGLDSRPSVLGDRLEYWNDDAVGRFHVIVPPPPPPVVEGAAPATPPAVVVIKDHRLRLALLDANQRVLAEQTLTDLPAPKAHAQVAVGTLPPGSYALQATLLDAGGAAVGEPVSFAFTRADKKQQVIAFPADGVPLLVEAQSHDPAAAWPVTAAVPLPLGAVHDVSRLVVEQQGRAVPSQVIAAARWLADDSVQWAHVSFVARYQQGQAPGYRLRLLGKPAEATGPKLQVQSDEQRITLDTGAIRLQVRRQGFAGIEKAWCDPQAQGRYDQDKPVIDAGDQGEFAPYLVDGRLVRYETRYGKDVTVEVEQAGPLQATIVARGWYGREPKQRDNLCQFVIRITATAGQPTLRISQHTIITFDTRVTRLLDVGFPIAFVGAERWSLGIDGQAQRGELPAIPQIKPRRDGTRHIPSVYLVQERWDGLRVEGAGPQPLTGKQSDGWFTVRGGDGGHGMRATLSLRDIWQKFPKEVQLSRQAMTLHLWPAHGRSVFDAEDEVTPQNIYKFQTFHHGRLLDLNLPSRYFEALEANPETWIECWPQNALNGNGQGLAMSAEFELALAPADDDADATAARRAALAQQDPYAMAPPTWNADTQAAGKIAAEDPAFAAVDEALLQGMLSYQRTVERGQAYGMWIWPDTHNKWVIPENRPNLHRPWQNSHYHQAATVWIMWLRSGSPDMLRWARAANDHYRNVSTINYGELVTDANGNNRWAFQAKIPGAMYHCKAPTPWGSSDYGMVRNNDHAALAAHWTSPDAHLFAWLMSAQPRARDLYELWHRSVRQYGTMIKGTRREANTTLALLVSAYQHTHDPDLLPAIHGLGKSLRTQEPIGKQNPGPLWHPLWINRYYELTRDPEYVPFILETADRTQLADTWTLGLSALAYELSQDTKYLTQHYPRLNALPMTMLRAPGDSYDWHGMGPGPIGFRWSEMTWGHFLRQLQRAGVTALPPTTTGAASYPCASTRMTAASPPGLVVLALEDEDRAFALTLPRRNPHPALLKVTGPSGEKAFAYDLKSSQTDRPDTRQEVPGDGVKGLYRIEVRSHDMGLPMPSTDLRHEAALLDDGRGYFTGRVDGWLTPLKPGPCELNFASDHDDDAFNVRVFNGAGELIESVSLLRSVGRQKATIRLDPAQKGQELPWRVYLLGPGMLSATGAGPLLLAADPQSLAIIAKTQASQP